MCDVHNDHDLLVKAKSPHSVGKKCMKCERAAVTTARTKDPFCKDCFNAYFVHRFRATFGKVRLFTVGEKVLLAFSGGMNSRVLLGLAEEGLRLSAYKKLRFEPTVIIINEGAVIGQNQIERCQQMSECLSIASATGFPTLYTHIEQIFGEYIVHDVDELMKTQVKGAEEDKKSDAILNESGHRKDVTSTCEENNDDGGHSNDANTMSSDYGANVSDNDVRPTGATASGVGINARVTGRGALQEVLYESLVRQEKEDENLQKQLRLLFASCNSVTAQENLLISLRRQLLVEIARKLGYSKVLMGDTATRLAVRLIGNVAQGRGRTLPLDTGFIDDRSADVALIRPLREFPVNEVAMYAKFNGLHSVSIPHLTTLKSEHVSIERLTESFVAGLQVDFPSTVSTVFRTSDKLTVGGEEDGLKCALCQAPTGSSADPSVFTHLSIPSRDTDLWTQLCYGCKLTVKDMNCSTSLLPPFVLHQSKKSNAYWSEPPSCIKEFLLPKESDR